MSTIEDILYSKYDCDTCTIYGKGICPFEDSVRCTQGADDESDGE